MPQYFNTSLRNLNYRLRKFKAILSQELENIILDNENIIVEMITQQQLYEQGIEGRGIEISSYAPYAESTIRKKIKKGQPTNRVTLKDTGDFYKSLRIEFDDKGFYIVSNDFKSPYLLKKYGPTIFKLTDENLETLIRKYIKPTLAVKLKEYLQNG